MKHTGSPECKYAYVMYEGLSESYFPEPSLPVYINILGFFVVLRDYYTGIHLSCNTLALNMDG